MNMNLNELDHVVFKVFVQIEVNNESYWIRSHGIYTASSALSR